MTNFSFTDQPILDASDDKLDRHPFAQLIANELLTNPDCNSGVVGLTGSWGSGKSSVANLVEKEIGDKATVVRFEPWMIGTREALVQEFFITLGKEVFPEQSDQSQADKESQRKKFYRYASRVSSVISVGSGALSPLIPLLALVSGASESISGLFDSAAGGLEDMAKELTLQEARKEISNDLEKIKKPIIVVIDDIDRLDKTEVKTIFQLVKACADFPKVKYLLLYDRDQVLHALQDSVNNPEAFLEKIVNQVFDLPEATTKQREILLNNSIDSLSLHDELPSEDATRLYYVIQDLLLPGLPTIRHIKRFVNTVRALVPGVSDHNLRSFDPADFLVIEYLRQNLPAAYSFLREEASPQVGGRRFFGSNSEAQTENQKIRDEFIKSQPNTTQQLLEEAFRKLYVPTTSDREANSKRRYNTDYWRPVYLGFCKTRAVLSELDWQDFLSKLESESDLSNWISQWDNRGQRDRWVNALYKRSHEIPNNHYSRVLAELFRWGDKQGHEEHNSWFNHDYSWYMAIRFCCQSVFLNLASTNKVLELFMDSVQKSGALISPALIFGMEVSQYLPGALSEGSVGSDFDKITKLLSQKLSDEILSDRFWEHPDPSMTLSAWKYLDPAQYGEWQSRLAKSPKKLAKYLNLCIGSRRLDSGETFFDFLPDLLHAIKDIDLHLLNEDGLWARQYILDSAEKNKSRRMISE